MTPLTLTILSAAVLPARRGVALGAWGAVSGLAIALGPLVGGVVVQGLSWHWIFWLNVPIGLVALLAWELRAAAPMIPLRFFHSRGFSVANAASLLLFFGMFGSIFLLAQFLQLIRGYSPLEAGLRTLPWTGMLVLVGPVAGALSDRIGSRSLVVAGMALVAGALAWLAAVATPAVPYAALVAPFVLAGVGMSLFFAPTANAVLSAVQREEEGKASGVLNTIRQVGGVLGVAVLATVFSAVGGYASPGAFVDGLSWALWAGAAMVGLGAIAALGIPGRQAPLRHAAVPRGMALVPQQLAATPSHRRFLTGGVLGGLLGSVCCIAAAVAFGLGLSGAAFLGTLMDRYQLHFILASVGFVGWWLVRSASAAGRGGRDPRRVLRGLGRQVAFMGGAYVATLALTVPLSMLVNN